MTLTLSITNVERLDNGEATRLVLDRHGAVIGRSPHCDWCLPDPKNHVSGSHCEIDYRDGGYLLIDKSTNGTFVNGSANRLAAPHILAEGDMITVGPYRIQANIAGAPKASASAPPAGGGWGDWSGAPASPGADAPKPSSGWDTPAQFAAAPLPPAPAPAPSPPPLDSGGWSSAPSAEAWAAPAGESGDAWSPQPAGRWGEVETDDPWAKTGSAISGRGPMAQRFAPPAMEKPASPWDEPAPAASSAFDAPAEVDVWSRMASTNEVDWSRGGFGAESWATPQSPVQSGPSAAGGDAWSAFLNGANLTPEQVKIAPAEAAQNAGMLLKQLIAGLVVLLEARARAKAELGAQGTMYERDGNNPLKWARSPSEALAQMLRPPERGFMPAQRAVEDSFKDLQAHQVATLIAMQDALRATLDRFSPGAIRQRAETRGVLAKIIPSAREAELWRAYEKEFEGVVQGSDEAFMDVFSKAFREAYDRASRGGGHG